ncbi:MAG TPA: helix-turn-helix domain-containing protein [Bryobacteraceae bacterium]|jgi:hypothetical protein|nr:helix-turn-helix domain-containing protein [Bryobacteraceae bacterium]
MKAHLTRDPYLVKSVVHVLTIMNAFQTPGDLLRLRDVVERTGLGKCTCFRLLYTLQICGFAEKADQNRYRLLLDKKSREWSTYPTLDAKGSVGA